MGAHGKVMDVSGGELSAETAALTWAIKGDRGPHSLGLQQKEDPHPAPCRSPKISFILPDVISHSILGLCSHLPLSVSSTRFSLDLMMALTFTVCVGGLRAPSASGHLK